MEWNSGIENRMEECTQLQLICATGTAQSIG